MHTQHTDDITVKSQSFLTACSKLILAGKTFAIHRAECFKVKKVIEKKTKKACNTRRDTGVKLSVIPSDPICSDPISRY